MRPSRRRLLLSGLLPALVAWLASGCGPGGTGPSSRARDLVTISASPLPAATTGLPYEARITATGPHPPLVWHVVAGMLPPGLALDGDGGTLSGWPRRAGRFRATIEVRDGDDPALARDPSVAAATTVLSFEVTRGPVAVLPSEVPAIAFGREARHVFEAAGGVEPYAFALASGSLPAGMTLDGGGALGGTPGAGGTFAFAVRVRDAEGAEAERAFEVRVVVPPLVIATASLPDAARGFAYDAALEAKPGGGGEPYAWSVVPLSGVLPPGLSLEASTGRLLGTPTAAGTFPFRVRVADGAGQTAERSTSIRVNAGPVLLSVDPPHVRAGGGAVVLAGQGFQPGMTVKFGTVPAVAASVESATRASAVPPSSPPQHGFVPVAIANPDGGTHEVAAAFRYPLETVTFHYEGVKGGSRDHARGLAAGDVNGDGLCDLVHVGSLGIEVIRPVGPAYTGAWTTTVVRSDGSFNDVRLADVDADGDLDVVVLRSSTTDTVEVYLNDGTGKFPAAASRVTGYPRPPGHFPHTLAVGDVDGDGVPDVAFTSCRGNQGTLWVMRGLGDGSFVLVHTASGTISDGVNGCFAPNAVVLVDLDGDGRDDVVVTDSFPACCAPGYSCVGTSGAPDPLPGARDIAAWWALSGSTGAPGAWRAARLSGANAYLDGDNEGLAVYDHDGDGRKDVAVFGGYQDLYGKGIAFLVGDGSGHLTERFAVATTYDRRFGARIDADLDGGDDLIVVGGDGTVGSGYGAGFSVAECWLGGAGLLPRRAWTSGPETLGSGSIPGSNPGRVTVGDFDGDGLEDFAVDQSFDVKERFGNDQDDGAVEGVAVYLNRGH